MTYTHKAGRLYEKKFWILTASENGVVVAKTTAKGQPRVLENKRKWLADTYPNAEITVEEKSVAGQIAPPTPILDAEMEVLLKEESGECAE